MSIWRRRTLTTAVAAVAMVMLTSSSAFAWFCVNESRPAKANEKAGQSQAWMNVGDLLVEDLTELGVCPEGIDHVLENADTVGISTDATILLTALAGKGRFISKNAEKLAYLNHNGKGIGHLDVDWEAFVELIEEGAGLCE